MNYIASTHMHELKQDLMYASTCFQKNNVELTYVTLLLEQKYKVNVQSKRKYRVNPIIWTCNTVSTARRVRNDNTLSEQQSS